MEKIALITDSTSDLNKEIIDKYNIKVLPLRIIYKDREYTDRVNITPQEVYDNLKYEVPYTSLPSMQDMENLFNSLEKENYTHIIVIPISSGLSGTYNALKLVSNNHPNLITTIFDSKSLTLGTGALVIGCAELLKQGKSYSEAIEALPLLQKNISVFYVVDTLEYLIKGGRIGKVSGKLGTLLNIKPIISINSDGIYYTYKKVRGKKQALNQLISIAQQVLDSSKCKIWVMHGGALDEGKQLYSNFETLPNITSLNFGDISPVAGVHTGPGLIGIVIVKEMDI